MFFTTRHMRARSHHAVAGALCALSLSLAACGGGGGTGSVPTASAPTASSSPAPVSQSTTTVLSTSGMTALEYGAMAKQGTTIITNATVGLPQIDVPQTNAAVTMSTVLPSGVPAPAARVVHAKTHQALGASTTPLVYLTLTTSNTVTLTQTPVLFLSLAVSVTQPCYLVAYDPTNPSAGWTALAGPFSASNGTLTIPSTTIDPPLWLEANQPYVFAIVESSSTVATPAPGATSQPTATSSPIASPTAAPSNAPTSAPTSAPTGVPTSTPAPGVVTLSPASITLNAIGATASLNAAEGAYTGSFTASSSNSSVATISQTSSGNFTITAVVAGTATITVSDDNGHTATAAVTVTTTEVIIH